MKNTLWKNNLNSVKNVPTIYVNVIIVTEKKNWRSYFHADPRIRIITFIQILHYTWGAQVLRYPNFFSPGNGSR